MITPDYLSQLIPVLDETPCQKAFMAVRGLIDSRDFRSVSTDVVTTNARAIDRWPSDVRIVRTTWENLDRVVELPSWDMVRTLEILSINAHDESDRFSAFVQSPNSARLKSIIWRHELNDEHIEALTSSRYTSELESLSLDIGSISDAAIELLAKSSTVSQLRLLKLRFPLPIFGKCSRAYETLFSEKRFPNLESLSIIFPPDGAIDLINRHRPTRLNSLILQLFDPEPSFEELIRSSALLTELNLLQIPSSKLGDQRTQKLVRLPYLQKLSLLDLTDNSVGSEGVKALSDAAFLSNLSELHLGLNSLDDDGWKIIGGLKCDHLTKLCLDKTQGGDIGLESLSQSWTNASLRVLSLQGNTIGWKGAETLANSNWTDNLTELWLDNNPLGDDGTVALAKGNCLANLESLSLKHADVESRGFLALVEAKNNRRLRTLSLNGANLLDAPLRKLSFASFAATLRDLSLSACDLANNDITELCSNDGLPQLRVLRLGVNHFNETIIDALKGWKHLRQLWVVDLRHDRLGDAAMAELATAGALMNVAELHIECTDITRAGIERCMAEMPRLKLLVHHELRDWAF